MFRAPRILEEEEYKLVSEYLDLFEDDDEVDDDDLITYVEGNASELLRQYMEYRNWIGDEGQLCDGRGNDLLMDPKDRFSWIQEWDVDEEGNCLYEGTHERILNTDGSPIMNPILDPRVEILYFRERIDMSERHPEYKYEIWKIERETKWIYIRDPQDNSWGDELDIYWEYSGEIELFKRIIDRKGWNIKKVGVQGYGFEEDPLNLVFECDDLFGLTIMLPDWPRLHDAISFLTDFMSISPEISDGKSNGMC